MRDLTPERLTRLLAMLTYFGDGREVSFSEAATHFGISETQLLSDINTLWVSGAPGYTHADLIDFEASAMDRGVIQLRESQKMTRPLRLSPTEAVTLLVALNSLIARLDYTPVLESTHHKLMLAAGEAAQAAEAVHVERAIGETQVLRGHISDAIEKQRQIWIKYVSGVDTVTERTIDPIEMQVIEEHWVLDAWCYHAGAPRQFRLDRILEYELLSSPVSTNAARPKRLDPRSFHHEATLTLDSSARWVAEQIPTLSITEHPNSFTVVIGASDPRWLENLCLRLGDSLISVKPDSLANAVATRASSALDLYEQG